MSGTYNSAKAQINGENMNRVTVGSTEVETIEATDAVKVETDVPDTSEVTTEEILGTAGDSIKGKLSACLDVLFRLIPIADSLDTGAGLLTKKAINSAGMTVRADVMAIAKALKPVRKQVLEAVNAKRGSIAGIQAIDKKEKLQAQIEAMQAKVAELEAEMS